MWYSVDIGPVHLISFSSEVYYTADDRYIAKQREWLAEDLKRANENRARTPWIVAISHRPLYCSSTFANGCSNKEFVVRDSLEKLFADNGVDLLLGGHVHSYERTWPTYNGEITAANYSNPSAPVTVISGGAGSGVTPIDPLNATAGPWTAYRMKNPVFSYGVLSVTNSTHLRWQQKASSDQHVIDSFWLVQSDHGTPPAPHEASTWKAADYINRVKDVINSNKGLAIGLASAFAAFVIFGCVCIVVRCRRRRGVTRRWEVVDYDKSFYSDVKTEEDDFAFDDPEPSLTSNGTQPTSKLLAHSNA